MPRGVSQRKGAPAVKKQAPVRAAKKLAAPLAPTSDEQAQLPAAIELPPAIEPAPTPAPARRPGRGAIDDMTGDDLKAYARSIGITQRDVDFLTEERLRQNCKARVYESMED